MSEREKKCVLETNAVLKSFKMDGFINIKVWTSPASFVSKKMTRFIESSFICDIAESRAASPLLANSLLKRIIINRIFGSVLPIKMDN